MRQISTKKEGELLHARKVGTRPIFIRSVLKKGPYRHLWTLFGTERIKKEQAKYLLHVKIVPSRSTFYSSCSRFCARVNGPQEIKPCLTEVCRFLSISIRMLIKMQPLPTFFSIVRSFRKLSVK